MKFMLVKAKEQKTDKKIIISEKKLLKFTKNDSYFLCLFQNNESVANLKNFKQAAKLTNIKQPATPLPTLNQIRLFHSNQKSSPIVRILEK